MATTTPASTSNPKGQQRPISNSVDAMNVLQSIYGSANFSKYEILRFPMYDTARYAPAGTTAITLFSIPLGGTDPVSGLGKTQADTNMVKPSSFGQQYTIITEIRTFVHLLPLSKQPNAIATDTIAIFNTYRGMMENYLSLLSQGVLNFNIAAKQYFDINQPFLNCPPGCGPDIQQYSSINNATTNFNSSWITQSPWLRDTYTLAPVQVIEPEQQFSVTINFPNGTSPSIASSVDSASPALVVRMLLEGYIARPLQ